MSYNELEITAKKYAEKHTMYFPDITLLRVGQKEAFQAGACWMRNIVWHSVKNEKPEPNRELLVMTKPNNAYMVFTSNSDLFDKIALELAYIDDLIPIW